jgi:hypothetical protein
LLEIKNSVFLAVICAYHFEKKDIFCVIFSTDTIQPVSFFHTSQSALARPGRDRAKPTPKPVTHHTLTRM